jgi:hypothetical protein
MRPLGKLCEELVVNGHEQPRGSVIEGTEGHAFKASLPTLLKQPSSRIAHRKLSQRRGKSRGKEIEEVLDICMLDGLLVVA